MMISVMRVLRWVLAAMAVSGLGLVCAQPLDMIRESRLREAALAWPSVSGRIVDSRVVLSVGRRTYYHVAVSYDYVAAGRHFAGDSIWLTGRSVFLTPEAAGRFLDRYPVGNRVPVYYDPADPGFSTLIRAGNGMQEWRYLEYGLVLLVVAGMWWSVPKLDWSRKAKT
jgi:uncharacterized protein DUF3592